MTHQQNEKPLGMRIGENVFCIGYLLFALTEGIIFTIRTLTTGRLTSNICAVMTLLLAVLVAVSFVCYMIVVLGARKKPMLGMMMIPKTICYIWMIALFL